MKNDNDNDNDKSGSGDSICIRTKVSGLTTTYVVDCGYEGTHKKVLNHFEKYYENPESIDKVVLTHPDQDHASGMESLIKSDDISINEIWMLCPWDYVSEIVGKVSTIHTEKSIENSLKEKYPYVLKIENAAKEKGIPIYSPFQGSKIGEFEVLYPSKAEYIDLLVDSAKKPFIKKKVCNEALENITDCFSNFISMIRSEWGKEKLDGGVTSCENEMSVVHFADIQGRKILLTGDVGVKGLESAANYLENDKLVSLPGVNVFQSPHHGAKRNVSSALLDRWIGPKKDHQNDASDTQISAIASASDKDKKHPRKEVIRALIHRGASVVTTENGDVCIRANAPHRDGWGPISGLEYPCETEKD